MGIRCLLNGVISFLMCGEWIPHVYQDSYKKTNILASDDDFREGDPSERVRGELSYPGAYLITSKCKYCNKTTISWCTPEMYLRMGNTLK